MGALTPTSSAPDQSRAIGGTSLSLPGARVQSLVRELRFYKPHTAGKKKKREGAVGAPGGILEAWVDGVAARRFSGECQT